MTRRALIAGIILTRNEELHIERAVRSAKQVCDVVHVVDSRSSDRTRAIAENEGAIVHSGVFSSFSEKLNWAIDNIDFDADWVMRLDADEILSDQLIERLPDFLLDQPASTGGIFVRRRLWFMGRPMRFGGVYPRYSMRLWRPHTAYCEERPLDEHMLLRSGESVTLEADVEDIPLTSLSHWVTKHNEYSSLEATLAIASLSMKQSSGMPARLFGTTNERIRWIKERIFYRLPFFVRPSLYYFYRYFIKLGFLDGKSGLIFHFLHGFWYRFIVDAKIVELTQKNNSRNP